MSNSFNGCLDNITVQLEEFSFFVKLRNHPKYLHFLSQVAKCIREKHYQQDYQLIEQGEQCDQIFFIIEGNVIIQSEYKILRPLSTSQSQQTFKNANISTITQQINKSRYQTIKKVKLASKYDVVNEENALISRLQSRDNAICQTPCRVFELNFSDFQRIFSSQVNEIRHRMSLFSKYFNLDEIEQSSVLSFCQACKEQQYINGEKLYKVNEKSLGFYFVKQGTIEISLNISSQNQSKSQQVIVDLVSSSEFFGIEDICVSNMYRTYDATVQSEKAKILFIPTQYFDQERSFVNNEIGKMDIYKILMKLSKEKSRKYLQTIEKYKEQFLTQNVSQKLVQRDKSASQRVSIQEILNTESKANLKYRNSLLEQPQTHYQAANDMIMNPSFPFVLPPRPNNNNNSNNNINLNKSLNGNTKSSTSISSVLKLKIRNSSQSTLRSSIHQYIENENKRNRAESWISNQVDEQDNVQTVNTLQNDIKLQIGNEQLPIHSNRGVAQTGSLSGNYKVLFKKYLENKQNKASNQYPSTLNATSQSKEKQFQILNDLDQKIPLLKCQADERCFMISTYNNNIKSLTKSHYEKQELEYGGTLFNNLMVSNFMKCPLNETSNTHQFSETQKFFEKQNPFKVGNKIRVTMASFKSNKTLKQKENFNPTLNQDQNLQNINTQQINEDSFFKMQTSEENSPLKKKYSFSKRDTMTEKRKSLYQQNSFSDQKNRGSFTDNSFIMIDKSGTSENKKSIQKQNPKRRSITPLKQAQIQLQPLNCLKQQQINYKQTQTKIQIENKKQTQTKKDKDSNSDLSLEEYTESSQNTSKTSLSDDSSQIISYS
ncbi:cyclic nucleotide-binding domain protein (macronuclear) [Tetrahymena thermophila SB210]|uniref:Cyclic nucleotide-binding domain protein n=1 Tax=Tetrahymena thermophila (strain SB210) TaxID=312017 RepID=Q237S8_TETTS|nr:cyclic nucleotide-binding domain protein [Tetrahymena thermophila SB210]EAR92663.1 cyclic nucleotide-binding domain protein [Tetrahymena thermophila SB210]|eukprot:XP_001012908.1 cyclic nucleotide-binding domain protein [Tetrahymena thermophila SB210]